jgi:hypothetical protein
MESLFVVPCRFDASRPVIYECIDAIQRHHENPRIVVVDSGSSDKSYFDFLIDRGVRIASINNQLYATGAHAWAFVHHPDIEFFYLVFDSLIVTANLDEFQQRPLTIVRHWHSTEHDWGWDEDGTHLSVWGGEQLARMGVPMPTAYHGIMGPMMFAHRDVLQSLYDLGYWFTQTTSAYKQCATERAAGIVLEHLGFDVTQSLQGTHTRHEDPYSEAFVKKIDMARI